MTSDANAVLKASSEPEPALEATLRRARELMEEKRFEEAAGAWREVIALAPSSFEGHKYFVQSSHKLGLIEASLPSLRWLARNGNVEYRRLLIRCLISYRLYAEACSEIQLMLEASPEDPQLWTRLARCAGAAGRGDMAADAWQRLSTIGPKRDRREYDARTRMHRPSGGRAKIVLMGNCQVRMIASCLRALLPDADVVTVTPADILDRPLSRVIHDEFANVDAIVSQPLVSGHWGSLRTAEWVAGASNPLLIPNFLFTGFHPDLLHIPVERWKGPPSPFGEFHSALAMAAFRRGVAQDRAADLFNTYIFQRIGYFEEYAIAKEFLLGEAGAIDFDLGEELREWEGRGIFVHTPNHPKIWVLWSIARKIAKRLGLDTAPGAAPPPDPYRANVWPVYPELARRMNLEASYIFNPPKRASMTLDDLIASAYAIYSGADFEAMQIPVVDHIMAKLAEAGV